MLAGACPQIASISRSFMTRAARFFLFASGLPDRRFAYLDTLVGLAVLHDDNTKVLISVLDQFDVRKRVTADEQEICKRNFLSTNAAASDAP
jgi:hypothetical protein